MEYPLINQLTNTIRKLNIFKTPQDFLDANINYLEENELVNNLTLGIINNISDKTKEYKDHNYISVTDNGSTEAISVSTSPRIIISGDQKYKDAIQLISKYYIDSGQTMSGVIGEKAISKLFADETGLRQFKERGLIVHELVKVNEVPVCKGSFEKVKQEEAELIAGHRITFEKETFGFTRLKYDELLKDTETKIRNGNLFSWKVKDEIVSMAAIMRNTKNIGIIGLVYTPPQFRGNGYATVTVLKLSELIFERGFSKCGLFTDISNPTSNHIYYKIGYRPVTHFADIYFN